MDTKREFEAFDYDAFHANLAGIPDDIPPAPPRLEIGEVIGLVANVSAAMVIPFLIVAGLVGGTAMSICKTPEVK